MKKLLLILFFFSTVCLGKEPESSQAQLQELRAEISRVQKILHSKESEKTDLAFAVQQSHVAQKKLEKTLNKLRKQKSAMLDSFQALTQKVKQGQAQYALAKKQLSAFLLAQYLAGQPNYLALILKGKSPNSAKRNHFYWQSLNASRQATLTHLRTDIREQELLLRELEQEKVRLANLEKTMQEKEAQLAQEKQEKSALLLSLQKEVLNHQERILNLEKKEKNLSALLGHLQRFSLSNNTPFQKGMLIWPLKNALRQKNGHGVFLKAEVGHDVLATANGRVVFADWLRGFGLLVIVDHGASYLSIYAHNDEILKEVGDVVQQGDVLASSGQNVENAQSGVYFEIRHQGKPVDPFLWVKQQ